MAEIVDSLFGPTPLQINQAQNAALGQSADRYAAQDPFARATGQLYRAGGMLAGPVAEQFGMVNPAIEEARRRQAVMQSGGDLSTSAGLKAKAAEFAQAGDQQTAMKLLMVARKQEAEEQKAQMDFVEMRRKEAQTQRELALAERALRPEGEGRPPASVQEYLYARQQGYKGSFEDWKKSQKVEGTKVVLPRQEDEFEKQLGGAQAKELVEGRKLADDAVQMIQTNKIGRQILDKGMVTGFGANAIVGIGQALKQAGINFGGDASANAQAYTAVMAQNVGKLIKQFGSGTGLSDADREYATKMAAGSIAVDEAAIRKVLDINDRAAKNVITLHNKRAGKVKTNVPLTVDIPEETGSDLAAAAKAELEKRKGNK